MVAVWRLDWSGTMITCGVIVWPGRLARYEPWWSLFSSFFFLCRTRHALLPFNWYTGLSTDVFSDRLKRAMSPEPGVNFGGRFMFWHCKTPNAATKTNQISQKLLNVQRRVIFFLITVFCARIIDFKTMYTIEIWAPYAAAQQSMAAISHIAAHSTTAIAVCVSFIFFSSSSSALFLVLFFFFFSIITK